MTKTTRRPVGRPRLDKKTRASYFNVSLDREAMRALAAIKKKIKTDNTSEAVRVALKAIGRNLKGMA